MIIFKATMAVVFKSRDGEESSDRRRGGSLAVNKKKKTGRSCVWGSYHVFVFHPQVKRNKIKLPGERHNSPFVSTHFYNMIHFHQICYLLDEYCSILPHKSIKFVFLLRQTFLLAT